MSYADRDKYGIYQRRSGASSSVGLSPSPGPSLMGADTLIGDSVVNGSEESLADIKEIICVTPILAGNEEHDASDTRRHGTSRNRSEPQQFRPRSAAVLRYSAHRLPKMKAQQV